MISLAKFSATHAYARAVLAASRGRRLEAEFARLREEVLHLREELRIKDVRMGPLPPQRRSHYPPIERMAILELRAACNWSLADTAKSFLVTPATITSWMCRLEEEGPEALVQLRQPVNKFPDFVKYLVCRLRTLCPTMGKAKLAQTLARAGLHLGATTVGRMLKQPNSFEPSPTSNPAESPAVAAKRPNQVWHVDLTTVPITSGFWVPWLPQALHQRWPFCWWLAVVLDHFSRRAQAVATFSKEPTARQIVTFLRQALRRTASAPEHLICDRGVQFDCQDFRRFCRQQNIRPRYGAIGKHGSLAVVERFILTFKQGLQRLSLVPLRRATMRREVTALVVWYNEYRPHTFLAGRTPNEIYERKFPANRRPRFEPRSWPRSAPCARPWALTRGRPGAQLELEVQFHGGRKHLPIVTLNRAA